MKKLPLLLLILCLATQVAFCQNYYLGEAGIDVGSGFKSNAFAPSVLYHEETGLRQLPWLKAGLGLRAWGYYGGKTNLYSQNEKQPGHTLDYQNVSANGISFVAGIKIKVWKLEMGANTDLAGFSFGSKRTGFYPENSISPGVGQSFYNQRIASRPVFFNVLPLLLSNYNGQSEAFARIWVTRKVGIKLGYLFGQIAYATTKIDGEKILLDKRQRRFSDRYQMPYVALSFPILQ